MTLNDFTLLLCVGAAVGLIVRYFLALDMRPHTAVYLGVLAVAVGPWLVAELQVWLEDWSPGQILTAAAGALTMMALLPALYAQVRKAHRHHPSSQRRPMRRAR